MPSPKGAKKMAAYYQNKFGKKPVRSPEERRKDPPRPGDPLQRGGKTGMEAWCTECEVWNSYTVDPTDKIAFCDVCGEAMKAAWPPDGCVDPNKAAPVSLPTSLPPGPGPVARPPSPNERIFVINLKDGDVDQFELTNQDEAIEAYKKIGEDGMIIRGVALKITYGLAPSD